MGLGLALLLGVAACAYLYVRMDDEIRAHVEGLLSSRYPQLRVSVGGARIIEGKGIAVYDLTLAANGDGDHDGELLAIDELLLCCDVHLQTLVQGTPPVHRVEVKRPQIWLRRNAGGRWNIESLLPYEPCGMNVPHVFVRGGVITVSDEVEATRQALVLRDVELSASPVAGGDATDAAPSMKIEGTAGGPHVRKAQFRATVDGKQSLATAELSFLAHVAARAEA